MADGGILLQAMREKYTKESASIHYFCIEWDTSKSSWADFRGKVLGATDPTTADEGSLRREILDKYADLGLTEVPNVGDNGVHASASPFEALAERCVPARRTPPATLPQPARLCPAALLCEGAGWRY